MSGERGGHGAGPEKALMEEDANPKHLYTI